MAFGMIDGVPPGGTMAIDAVLKRFVKKSPVSVMARLTVQRAISSEWVDSLFEEHRKTQYTRELFFSTVVELMSLVALGMRPSLHAAAKSTDLKVSIAALYDKINRTDPELVRALVQGSAERLAPVLDPMNKPTADWARGYRIRVIDGNHLPASEKRLKPLRGFRGAALPGHSLVVYAPEQRLVVDLVPIEDAHAHEQTAIPAALELAKAGDLWIADRNFSTKYIFFKFADRGAVFIIREHGACPHPTPIGDSKRIGRIDTGELYEQPVQIKDDAGRILELRRIEVHLDTPTEDGETIIRLLSIVPVDRLSAEEIAALYRRRWSIENMFQRLEAALNSELSTLGHPRAALLAFGTAVVAYNALSVLETAVEAAHPEAKAAGIELSTYFVADEVRANYPGMMVAIPDSAWKRYDGFSARRLGRVLLEMAASASPRRLRKHPRRPKKQLKKGYTSSSAARHHISTARVLAAGRVDS